MALTTPVYERYTRFSRLHPWFAQCNHPGGSAYLGQSLAIQPPLLALLQTKPGAEEP
jgi:hypothetical protein